MRYIILLALLSGCVNYDGLEERTFATPTMVNDNPDTMPPDTITNDTEGKESGCSVTPIDKIHHCMIDVPAPGITDSMYLFISGYTDGIMGGDAKHYDWYRIVGQNTIIIINCGSSYEGKEVAVSYGCLP